MNDHVYQIPINPENPFGLGRHVHHDVRNFRNEHMALIAPPKRSIVPNPLWYRRGVFDQGETSSCVPHATVGLARTMPFSTRFTGKLSYDTEPEILELYDASQQKDPYPGPPPAYDGTSSDATYQVLRERGEIASWKWLKGEAEVREWLTWYGPCTIGIVWLDNMFYPNAKGFLDVSGAVAGGHEIEVVRYDPLRDAYRLINSWGPGWGQGGRCSMASIDMRSLLDQDGDAVTIG
jgi:hypothetical protein